MESVNNEYVRTTEPSNFLFCRACLATEEKFVDMQENNLVTEFFRVTGIIDNETNRREQHLCVWCTAILKRCAAFRAKCLRADQCLQSVEEELTTDSVRSLDRVANRLVALNQTEIEIVSIDSSVVLEPISIVNLNDTSAEEHDDVKKENMEIDRLSDNKIEIIVKGNKDVHTIKLEPDASDDDEDIFENISAVALKSELSEPTNNNLKKVIEIKKGKVRKRAKSTAAVKAKRQRKKKVEIPENGEGKRSEKKYKKRSAENDYMPNLNMEEFKNTYDVDIFILTREEQIAEIEARRATDKYKTARYTCEPCGKFFRAEEAYDHHKAKHAVEAGPFECPVCKIGHRCKATQMRHYDSHRFKFVCRQCGFVSRTRTQAKLHHAWHDGKKYQCKYCEKEFSKRSTWLGHVRMMHKSMNVACELCGETFVNSTGLKCHKVYVHAVATQKEIKSMECPCCAVTFVTLDALNKHKMAASEHKMAAEHGELRPCVQCGDTFRSGDQLEQHLEAEHPSCQECNSTFLNAASYAVHIKRKHFGKGDGRHERRMAANARARAHGLPLPFPPPKNTAKAGAGVNANRQVCCELCGKIFSNQTMLSYHLRKHRGEKLPYACALCPKSFYIKQQLEHHIRVHTGEKPHKCDQCDLAFTVKGNLTRHLRVVHMGIRRKTECNICGHFFATPFTMKMHVRTVHNGEPWPKRAPRKKKPQKDLE